MTLDLTTAVLLPKLGTVVLVDAHGAPYYRNGHLPGAVNVPPHQVRQRAPVLLPDRHAEIVVYGSDAGTTHARIVIDQLRRLGYANLSLYVDGIEGWVTAGLPVESSPDRPLDGAAEGRR